MKVKIQDYYFENQSINIRIPDSDIYELSEFEQSQYRAKYVGKVTESQVKRIRRELPNGARGLNVTEYDSYTGKEISGEVYFN